MLYLLNWAFTHNSVDHPSISYFSKRCFQYLDERLMLIKCDIAITVSQLIMSHIERRH